MSSPSSSRPLDALPAALQSPGEAASAEVVHTHPGAGEEEDHQGHDCHGAGTETQNMQLPALDGLEGCLQEVSISPINTGSKN